MSDLIKQRNALHQHFHEPMPGVTRIFDNSLKEVCKDGALRCSVAVGCEPCTHDGIEAARNKGASEEQLTEALGVGFETGIGKLLSQQRRVLKKK